MQNCKIATCHIYKSTNCKNPNFKIEKSICGNCKLKIATNATTANFENCIITKLQNCKFTKYIFYKIENCEITIQTNKIAKM